jgi:hypothetical protein
MKPDYRTAQHMGSAKAAAAPRRGEWSDYARADGDVRMAQSEEWLTTTRESANRKKGARRAATLLKR